MQGIIDILEPDGDNAYTFTVDNTVLKVGLNSPVVLPAAPELTTSNAVVTNEVYFQNRDNLNLLSLGIRIPYCFSLADDHVHLRLRWENAAATQQPVWSEISDSGWMFIPLADREIDLGIFIAFPTVTAEKFKVVYELDTDINMANGVPALFQDEDIPIYPYLKVQHTLPMIA